MLGLDHESRVRSSRPCDTWHRRLEPVPSSSFLGPELLAPVPEVFHCCLEWWSQLWAQALRDSDGESCGPMELIHRRWSCSVRSLLSWISFVNCKTEFNKLTISWLLVIVSIVAPTRAIISEMIQVPFATWIFCLCDASRAVRWWLFIGADDAECNCNLYVRVEREEEFALNCMLKQKQITP